MDYQALPIDLECGDLLAFSGTSLMSRVISTVTDWPRKKISHVGVMVSPTLLAEATTLNGEHGVTVINLEYKLNSYPGEIYAALLEKDSKDRLDKQKFTDFLLSQDGQPYSKLQALLSTIHAGPELHNWASSWYCSKLAAEAYREAGVLLSFMNTAVTPSELVDMAIFGPLILLKEKNP